MNHRPTTRAILAGSLLFSLATLPSQAVPTHASTPTVTNQDTPALSEYSNDNHRPDPFLPVKLKGKGVEASVVVNHDEFQLQGILWHPTSPVAIINRKRVLLNEPVVIKLPSGETTVKATLIERERVVLKVGDSEVELKMAR